MMFPKPSTASSSILRRLLRVDETVQEALKNGEPIVSLESTIVAHGMPYPQNWETARSVENIVRSKGAIPATIAVRDGSCRIGLNSDDLLDLAKAGEENRAQKCSTRELSLILAKHYTANTNRTVQPSMWGATTVASTMTLAHAAGISCFVTGGIGGVHRSGEVSMDVSADLTELSRTPVVTVSAGIKSILDIPRTLEVLETNAVPTVSFQADEFPCFFSPNSGVSSPARVESAEEVALAYWAARALDLSHGMLVAVPPPGSAGEAIEHAIQEALVEADQRGLHGQAVTPFILKHVAETTGGASLRCNITLVQNNAIIGSDIAIAIAKQKNATSVGILPNNTDSGKTLPPSSRVIVMGGTVLDLVAKPKSGKLLLGTSNPANTSQSDGGVARNVAEVLGKLGSKPLLYSAVGDDALGRALKERQMQYGIDFCDSTISIIPGQNTATYLAVLEESNDLHTACADMEVMAQIQQPPREIMSQADILVLDANPPVATLQEAAETASNLGVDVYFEPTSVPKAILAAKKPRFLECLTGAFPNLDELIAMKNTACAGKPASKAEIQEMDEIKGMAQQLLDHMSPTKAHLVITLGSNGALLASRLCRENSSLPEYKFHYFPVTEQVEVRNSTGAGDSLCGAFLHSVLQGQSMEDSVLLGMQAASASLRSSDRTIAPDFSDLVWQ